MKINGIDIEIKRKNIKNMYLRITPPEAKVSISAPLHVSDSEITDFITSKMDWICKKRENILNNNYNPKLKYVDGEMHYLWGEKYPLKLISDSSVKTAFFDNNTIYLPVSKRSKFENRVKTLDEFYRRESKREILRIYDRCTRLVGKVPKEVKVRKMKNWGNCKQNKIITLNINLAKRPKICFEYVFIHELCHLIEFNHGSNFKKLMDKYCPNWREIKKKLNEE